MNTKIFEDIRRKIIRLWLDGKSRKDIALICGVSEGTVSNVIADWKQKLGEEDADALRELGINMKRSGTDAPQCAQGHRISMILKKMGVNEEDFESFISKICERCLKISGMTVDMIGSCLEDLLEFSDEDDNGGNPIKLSEIRQYIEQKKNEKRALKKDIQNLQKQKKISEEQASAANDLRDAALENEKVTVAELREYSKFKTELGKYGLSVDVDTRKLVQVIYGIKQRGYDVKKVLSEYSDIEFTQEKRDMLSTQVRALEDKIVNLRNQYSFLESQVNLHSQRLYVYDELDSMGFGLTKLKILRNAIKEIAAEDNISFSLAVDKFFEFVEKHYDIKLRQKVQEAQQQNQKEYTKPDNLNPTFPSHHDFKPSTALPNQSSLVEKQRQQQLPSTSISYRYTKITNASKKTQEQNDHQLNNDHDDEWYESDDDHSL
ncbi:MAG TPA: helix-turn-helix domain-containing protein [Nitrososphaeraceae archaeon]|nr:helix-turn-helix domain-containing protein [Nitrososphaeraceae archaeon]